MTSDWRPGTEVGPFEEFVRSISRLPKPDYRGFDPALLLCDHQHAQRTAFTVPYYGFNYSGYLNNYTDWHVYFYGAYHPFEM